MPIAYDRDLPVLIFRCGHYPLHAGSLAVVRSFGRVGVPVYGTYEDRFSPAAWSRYLTGSLVWRTRPHDTAARLKELCQFGTELETKPLLVPTDDRAAILIAENAETLRSCFRFPEPPPSLPRAVVDKRALFLLCEKYGIPRAASTSAGSTDELNKFLRTATFPLVVKIAAAWQFSARVTIPSTSLAPDAATARRLFERAVSTGCHDLIFQEYIPSDGQSDWFFHGYSDSSGRCLVSFTGQKLRSCPPGAGPTAYCRSEANARLRHMAEDLIAAISFRGIVDLDLRFDARDGTYKLLDFNPRLGAQFALFQDANEIDVVRAMHLDLSGREIPRAAIRSRCLLIEDLDLRVAFRYRSMSFSALRAWLSELRNASEHGWYARDDLWPFAVMVVRNVAHLMRKLVRRLAGHAASLVQTKAQSGG